MAWRKIGRNSSGWSRWNVVGSSWKRGEAFPFHTMAEQGEVVDDFSVLPDYDLVKNLFLLGFDRPTEV